MCSHASTHVRTHPLSPSPSLSLYPPRLVSVPLSPCLYMNIHTHLKTFLYFSYAHTNAHTRVMYEYVQEGARVTKTGTCVPKCMYRHVYTHALSRISRWRLSVRSIVRAAPWPAPCSLLDPRLPCSCCEDYFYYCSERNNVVVLFGTLKVQSFILPEVSDCGLLIVVTSSTFLKRKDMLKEKSS